MRIKDIFRRCINKEAQPAPVVMGEGRCRYKTRKGSSRSTMHVGIPPPPVVSLHGRGDGHVGMWARHAGCGVAAGLSVCGGVRARCAGVVWAVKQRMRGQMDERRIPKKNGRCMP